MLANLVTLIAGDWAGPRPRRELPQILGTLEDDPAVSSWASTAKPLHQAVGGGRKEDRALGLQRKPSHGHAVEVTEPVAEVGVETMWNQDETRGRESPRQARPSGSAAGRGGRAGRGGNGQPGPAIPSGAREATLFLFIQLEKQLQ
jgi:hypothetical protein